jgi:hypothetical protein
MISFASTFYNLWKCLIKCQDFLRSGNSFGCEITFYVKADDTILD